MSLAGDTTTIDLCKQNPKWFGGYVQGLNHAFQLTHDEQIETLLAEYMSVLYVITGKQPNEIIKGDEDK